MLDEIVQDYTLMRQELLDDEGKIGNPLRSGNDLANILKECSEKYHFDDIANEPETEEAVTSTTTVLEEACVHGDHYLFGDYVAAKKLEQWDCETILSTYSNLDNHPAVISIPSRKNKKKKKKESDLQLASGIHNEHQRIELSKKSGLPLCVIQEGCTAVENDQEDVEEENFNFEELIRSYPKAQRKRMIKEMRRVS